MSIKTITWEKNSIKLIDQTLLPGQLKHIYCQDVKTLWHAIKRLSVRGAPALGAAAAYGVVLGAQTCSGKTRKTFDKQIIKISDYIATSRPTAVNLFNALQRMKNVLIMDSNLSVEDIKSLLTAEAILIAEEDKIVCRRMGCFGATLINEGDSVLTICNAGALATVDYGTALGVFYSAQEQKKNFQVYACETRPLLQGARLTAWELCKSKIDTTLICDSMAATLMKQGKIDAIFTGADRIASNGDSANKIGTYSLAVLAKYHKIPFYIVAPFSTFDMKIESGEEIPIEQRDKKEVMCFGSIPTAPSQVKVYNPAFDVTDRSLITAIITEAGIIEAPNKNKIKKFFK